jgi:hypothetical protein
VKGSTTALVAAVGLLACCGAASADPLEPVSLAVTAHSTASRHAPFRVRVAVTADPGALDVRTAPLRVRVRLAPECGGSFTGTAGRTILDRELSPQPAAGQAYSATATGAKMPAAYGTFAVCAFLEEEGDNRQFATETDGLVAVTHRCTSASDRYASLKRRLAAARKRHAHAVKSLRRRTIRARRAAHRRCT